MPKIVISGSPLPGKRFRGRKYEAVCRLHNLIEIDDALVGGRRSGKRGRGAEGKSPILIAIENRDSRAGFLDIQQVPAVTKDAVARFVKCRLLPNQVVRTCVLTLLVAIGTTQHHATRVTPPHEGGEWPPWMHISIGNLKAFLLGTYHGVSQATSLANHGALACWTHQVSP